MAEFTIFCGNCGSTNCELENEYWDDGDYFCTHIVCNDCWEKEPFM